MRSSVKTYPDIAGRTSIRAEVWLPMLVTVSILISLAGCQTPTAYRQEADQAAGNIIREKQQQVLGKTEPFSVERPSDILRRRLLTGQKLLYSNESSLGTDQLKAIAHWPEKNFPAASAAPDERLFPEVDKPLTMSLIQALQIGARNSFEYQQQKEDVFQSALSLDLERNDFRNIFTGRIESLYESDSTGKDPVRGTQQTAAADLDKKLKSGAEFSTALAIDLANLLTMGGASSLGIVADASISIPLLRGSGKHIVTEPLTQAERNVMYALYEFERFKREFAVNIASEYFDVMDQINEVRNTAENYRNLMRAANRSRRMAEAGRLSEVEADQAVQKVLSARRRWISAQESYKNRTDSFKFLIGLPPDAVIELDMTELDRLLGPASAIIAETIHKESIRDDLKTPAADDVIELVEPNRDNAGPLELDESVAIKLALNNRLDLRVAQGKVYDAQRKVIVMADALRAELTLFGRAELGQSRSIEDAERDDAKLRTDKGIYTALLTLDLPFERTAERNAYRNSFFALEQSVREVQQLEDQIKLNIRRQLRNMLESRERLKIQAKALAVAQKRVKSVNLFLEAGRAQIRDLTDAQEDLLDAQNGLATAAIDNRIAELAFQRDAGVLDINAKGLWKEYSPEETENVTN